MSTEPRVVLPDVKAPVRVKRSLVVPDGEKGREVIDVPVTILVNGCLYLVEEDEQGLRAGQILSRNLDLTRHHGRDPTIPEQQVFVVFTGLNAARRGLGRIDDRYRDDEIPELAGWATDADWLLRTSWTLYKAGEKQRADFYWRANRRRERHVHDRATHKRAAEDRLIKVASETDSRGRRNPSRIPLLCMAIDRSLQARTQEVRGIGRHMDWRVVVLEHVIDDMRRECRKIRRAAQDALTSPEIFADKRTPRTLRTRATRMRAYAESLKELRARPFRRALSHVLEELEQSATLLMEAAERRDTGPLEGVINLLKRIYGSMALAEEHWRIEEILVVVADHHHRRVPLSEAQVHLYHDELTSIHTQLTSPDPITAELIGSGFRQNVLPSVIASVLLSVLCLRDAAHIDLKALHSHLKSACEPI